MTCLFAIPIFASLVTFNEVFNFLVKFFSGSHRTKFQIHLLGNFIPSLTGLTACDALNSLPTG